jgi:uncharacterized protein YcaQ
MQLTREAARLLNLIALGLDRRADKPATKEAVLAVIRRMQVLQIDTINVVARSPYLVLWSRLGDYEPHWLDELLAEAQLFEHWSHEACFIPIEDYPLYRRLMLERYQHSYRWITANKEETTRLLTHIREVGVVRARDFERTDGQKSGWWNWKPEKQALEMLHTSGELMIAARHNFQRLYDLRERVLPEWDDARTPEMQEVMRQLALKAVKSLGIAALPWVKDYFRALKKSDKQLLEELADEGLLLRATIEPDDKPSIISKSKKSADMSFYIHPDNRELAEAAQRGGIVPELTTLLSPFDPLTWDRKRASFLFDFDYTIECYTPAEKRIYGYFSLPILRKGALVGRLDAKAHRKDKKFEVKALHYEKGLELTEELVSDVKAAIQECANWHKTPHVVYNS